MRNIVELMYSGLPRTTEWHGRTTGQLGQAAIAVVGQATYW
jgi:hypothetical protein